MLNDMYTKTIPVNRDLLDNIRQTLYMYLHDRQTMTQEEHEKGMQSVIDQIDDVLGNE